MYRDFIATRNLNKLIFIFAFCFHVFEMFFFQASWINLTSTFPETPTNGSSPVLSAARWPTTWATWESTSRTFTSPAPVHTTVGSAAYSFPPVMECTVMYLKSIEIWNKILFQGLSLDFALNIRLCRFLLLILACYNYCYFLDLYSYIEDHTDGLYRGYRCMLCGKAAKDKGNLRKHVENIHFPGQFEYPCKICQKPFSTRNRLNHHVSKEHPAHKLLSAIKGEELIWNLQPIPRIPEFNKKKVVSTTRVNLLLFSNKCFILSRGFYIFARLIPACYKILSCFRFGFWKLHIQYGFWVCLYYVWKVSLKPWKLKETCWKYSLPRVQSVHL